MSMLEIQYLSLFHNNWGEPYHMRSTAKSVFLLACMLVTDPYMVECKAKSHLSVNYACKCYLYYASANHKLP